MRQLPIEQTRALVAWEKRHGRFWKSYLRQAWSTGRYGYVDHDVSGPLQALRNTNAGWLNRQTDMSELKAQLHHYDLRVASQNLLDKLNAGHGHVYTMERVRLEGLLQLHPETYDGIV